MIEYWMRLPEVVRWLLLLPAIVLSWLAANLLVHGFMWVGGWVGGPDPGSLLAAALQAGASAAALFTIAFALAPRGKRVVGWILYVVLTAFAGIALLLLIARRLAMWGLLGSRLLPPPGVTWERADTRELIQAAVWVVFGTVFFRSCLDSVPSRATASPPAPSPSKLPPPTIP